MLTVNIPDSKVHVANMRPTWVLSVPDGPHVSPMNLAIGVYICSKMSKGNGIIFKAWMVFNKTALYHFVTHWYCLMSVTVFMYGVKHMTHLNLSCCMAVWVIVELPLTPMFMMMSSNGNIFCITGPLCWEFTGHRWIPCTKASDAEVWCFLRYTLK